MVLVLVLLSFATAVNAQVPPGNDDCHQAAAIIGEGEFAFDNTSATSDGPEQSCIVLPSIGPPGDDVWFCWKADCDGEVGVHSCRGRVDTKLEVYDGCQCPATTDRLIACNDDASFPNGIPGHTPQCAGQSAVSFSATAGRSYLIRIGNSPFPGLSGGTGFLTVECGGLRGLPCSLVVNPSIISVCQVGNRWTALTSSEASQDRLADDFTTRAISVQNICWWGAYPDGPANCGTGMHDAFEVTYYRDDGGRPGQVHAGPFRQSTGSLQVLGPVPTFGLLHGQAREYEYSASHAPVAFPAPPNEYVRFWVSIVNRSSDCAWAWEVASARSSLCPSAWRSPIEGSFDHALTLNFAFCLPGRTVFLEEDELCDYPQPANDSFDTPERLESDHTRFSTIGATTDGLEPIGCEFPLGSDQLSQDVWYAYTATQTGELRISLCETSFDARVAVYDGPTYQARGLLGCADDSCGDLLSRQPEITLPVVVGHDYLIRIGGAEQVAGTGTITLDYCDPVIGNCAADCTVPGDFDCDDNVTQMDFGLVPGCLTGPCREVRCLPKVQPGYCGPGDIDGDADIDLADVASYFSTVSP